MRFEVPQFIEIEDKIVGPLTFMQFVYVAGGIGAGVALFILIPVPVIALAIAAPIFALGMLLAFYKHNDRKFIFFLESMFNFYTKSRQYQWQKREKKIQAKTVEQELADLENPQPYVPKLSDSKLKDLTWSLDVRNSGQGEVL